MKINKLTKKGAREKHLTQNPVYTNTLTFCNSKNRKLPKSV